MLKFPNIYPTLFRITIPLLLLVALIGLMTMSSVQGNDSLALAISIDLLLTVPLVYFLLIRKTSIPKTTVVPIMLLGLLLGSVFLPKESQNYLDWFKTWLLPLVELTVVTFVVLKVRKALKTYRSQKGEHADFYETLKRTCTELLPKPVVIPFATEIAVFYYAFIHWKKRSLASNEFSYHKKSTTFSLLLAFILVIAAETVGLHFWLMKWNTVLAWILTALSVYTALQFIAYAKALSQRPITIDADSLQLRYSIMAEAKIPLDLIESVELSTKDLEKDKWTRSLSPFGELESHNVVLHFNELVMLSSLYGIQKKVKTLSLFVDEPQAFAERIDQNRFKH